MSLEATAPLVRDALSGSASAREALLRRLRPRLVLWCASRMSPALRAQVDAEDAAQEILVAVHRDLERLQGLEPKSFYAWLFRLAENRLRDLADHYGAAKRRPVELRAQSQTSPSAAAAREESRTRLHRAIEVLPEDYRRVIQLRRIEERDPAEVASLLGRSEGAVRVLYFRALKALEAALPRDT